MRSKGLSNRFVRLLSSSSSLTRKRPDLEFCAPGWVVMATKLSKTAKKLAWVCLKWNDTGYKWLVLCCYIGHAYRPHPAIPRVDSAVHAPTQYKGRQVALHMQRAGYVPYRALVLSLNSKYVFSLSLFSIDGATLPTVNIHCSLQNKGHRRKCS